MRSPWATLPFALSAAGCVIDFDERFESASATGATGDATTGTSQGGGAGPGGGGEGGALPCPDGCWDGGTCQPGDSPQACGPSGAACESCIDNNPCTDDLCVAGTCSNPALDGSLCPGGQCVGDVCTPLAENCGDGVDNNADGNVDCQDPICSGLGFGCVPPPPAGWTGPITLYTAASPGSCSGAFPTIAHIGGQQTTALPAVCSSCTCAQATCGNASFNLHKNDAAASAMPCSGCIVQWFLPPDQCLPDTLPDAGCMAGAAPYYAADGALAPTGSCAPSAQVPTLPPVNWAGHVTVCGGAVTSMGGCGTNVCAPPPAPGFNPTLCVYKAGMDSCPAPYTDGAPLFYTSYSDTRGCTACSCSEPTCTGSIDFYSDPTCFQFNKLSSFWLQVPSGASCASMNMPFNTASLYARYTPGGDGTVCQATQSTPFGGVAPTQPVTVCCLP